MFFSGPYVVQSPRRALCMKATEAYMIFVKFHFPVTLTFTMMLITGCSGVPLVPGI